MQRIAFKWCFMKYYHPKVLVWAVSCQVVCVCCPSRLKSFLLYKGKCFSCENTLDLIAVYWLEELLSGRCFVCCLSLKAPFRSSHVGSAYSGEPLHLPTRESPSQGWGRHGVPKPWEPSATCLRLGQLALLPTGTALFLWSCHFLLEFCCHN